MRKNGFTLIELLAVITILALVALVTSISVANMVKESKDELSVSQTNAIMSAAKSWGADNIRLLPTGNSCSYITLNDLKDEGILNSNIVDPKNKDTISNNLKIKITSKLNSKGKSILTYEVNPADINNCTYIGSPIYVDVPNGLTPVIYDGNNWKVPELNEEWYNYDKQMWANAVVLGNGKTKKPGDIVTVEGNNPDALMMLVYIPRYEYKIEGQYGKGGTEELPGEIEVKFINNSQTKADGDYILHPAFVFGDKQLSGIWVGKFEISHTTLSSSETENNLGCSTTSCLNSDGLRILPGVKSLRNNSVSNFWYGIKSIENKTSVFGLTNMDTHMMKNSEWGAVAYLSQSKYGKYGNSDYESKYKEVYQNKDTGYLTGKSNGTPSQSSRNAIQCAYNDMTNLEADENNYKEGQCGPGASTTGNIFGIYDMSGGADEYVMGVYGTDKNPTIGSSGFDPNIFTNETINTKYYDIYANLTDSYSNDGSKSCNNGICYGHGISEVMGSTANYGWYGDYTQMVNSVSSWFLRGRFNSCDTDAGVFSHVYAKGGGCYYCSTRFVGFGK